MSYYVLLTDIGQAQIANAVALGQQVKLTHIAVGDANGKTPQPSSACKALMHECHRAPINRVEVDHDNPNWIVLEQVLPPDVGGWEIREVGAYDAAGNLIAYGNYPPTYKPLLNEGTSRTQTLRIVMQVSDTAAVTLKVDPSVVLATRKYVDDGINKINNSFSKITQDINNELAQCKYLIDTRQPNIGYKPVQMGGGIGMEDGHHIKFGWTRNGEHGLRVQVDNVAMGRIYTEDDKPRIDDVRELKFTLENLIPVGTIIYVARDSAPNGYLCADGSAISRTNYSRLFNAIGTRFGAGDGSTTFNLPDLRGEFIRGWDKGRGVDNKRELGTYQKGSLLAGDDGAHETIGFTPNNIDNNTAWGVDSIINRTEYQDAKVVFVNASAVQQNNNMPLYQGGVSRPRNIALLACIKA